MPQRHAETIRKVENKGLLNFPKKRKHWKGKIHDESTQIIKSTFLEYFVVLLAHLIDFLLDEEDYPRFHLDPKQHVEV